MSTPIALDPRVAEFITSGLSVTVASRDERLVPSIAKGVGCRVDPAGHRLTVFVFSSDAEAVLRDVARCGRIAVTFSRPSTHQTVQFKGRDARNVPVGPADVALVRRYVALLAEDLGRLGWDIAFVESYLWHDPSELAAIEFSLEHAFQQTPGPDAGRPLPDGVPVPGAPR